MIESINNEKVKYYKKLRDKKNIITEQKYIVESEHLVDEAYKSGLLLEVITSLDIKKYNVKTTKVSDKVLKSISLLSTPPKVMGIVKLVQNKEIKGNKIILLDKVQDPGNVGTIIRSALAFNVTTVVLSDDSVNLYNDKMIRSSEGTIFKMNVVKMDLKDAIEKIHNMNIKVYYADMDGTLDLDELKLKNYAIVLGSEGEGIRDYIKEISDASISIKMNNACESLNVSVTGSIIMYKFR